MYLVHKLRRVVHILNIFKIKYLSYICIEYIELEELYTYAINHKKSCTSIQEELYIYTRRVVHVLAHKALLHKALRAPTIYIILQLLQ